RRLTTAEQHRRASPARSGGALRLRTQRVAVARIVRWPAFPRVTVVPPLHRGRPRTTAVRWEISMDRAAADDSSEPDVIGFGDNSDVDHSAADRRHGRRALVISALALVAVFAVAGATIAYLSRPKHGQVHTPTHVAGFTLDSTSDAAATASYL